MCSSDLDWLKVKCIKEVYTPHSEHGFPTLHMDIVIYAGSKMLMPAPLGADGKPLSAPVIEGSSHSAKGLMLDTHLTDQMRMQFHKAKKPGKAAELGTKKKFNHYEGTFSPSRCSLFPFVAEFDGLLGLHAHVFIAAAADYQHEISEGAWLRSECVRNWRQSVSLALQEVISITGLRTRSRTVSAAIAENQGQPDLLAYIGGCSCSARPLMYHYSM